MKHLVFYDGSCGFCDHVVQWILKHDQKAIFIFAPLQGSTAEMLLKGISKNDSLVLIEDYKGANQKMYLFGKAAFRILWLLGGAFTLLGWISFLPSFLYDWGYLLVAKNRHKLFPSIECQLPDLKLKDRFLP